MTNETIPFDLDGDIIEFDDTDPYNPKNTLKGYVNRTQGQYYGSLYITHVNGKSCPQLIFSCPKQHYPFDKEGKNWKFPEFDYIECFEKYDGTCVISYKYHDANKNKFLTYKTRLRPFLGSSKFGNFFAMWNEMLEKYPEINNMCHTYDYNFVFELYGKRNKILIEYKVPLDTKLTFAVNRLSGVIIPPTTIQKFNNYKIPTVQKAKVVDEWQNCTDYVKKELYISTQDKLESELTVDEENHILTGKEGYVWYFIKDGATQIKCKPPTVLKYHWSAGAIPFESIFTTVVNAFENFDEPKYADVVQLLHEEFDVEKIEKSCRRIEKILSRVTSDKKFQYKIAKDYEKLNMDINDNKVTVMRWFSKHYPKSEAKRIHRLLMQYEESKCPS